ncbi:MAG: methyltransferase [Candidatus Moraniibacteriota bacterium]
MLATNKSVISKISRHIDLKNKKKFYDLGSGNGSLISYVAKKYPELECVGVEYNIGAYTQALIRRYFSKVKVSYQRKDFFKIDISSADVIYVYLFPGIINRLEKKFATELRQGTLVIANSFPLKFKKPKKIIKGKDRALDTLYIYEY